MNPCYDLLCIRRGQRADQGLRLTELKCRKLTNITISRRVFVDRFVAFIVRNADCLNGGFNRGLVKQFTGFAPRCCEIDKESFLIRGRWIFCPPHGLKLFLRQRNGIAYFICGRFLVRFLVRCLVRFLTHTAEV